ncbi:MAG: acyltransferase family protein [Bacteroidota bacterium]
MLRVDYPLFKPLQTLDQTVAKAPKAGRIVFIDVLRAYAILMMLQGHFVDTLLAEQFRNPESTLYYVWSFMRGMTAPIFFTVTGLVFVFLLLRDGRPMRENTRMKKGIRRGFFLLYIGYLLKVNFPALLVGYLSPWILAIDVLHIIGLALIGLIAICALREFIGGSLVVWMLAFGAGTFLIDPFFTENSWAETPRFFAHYLTRDFGSNFTIVPWLGFAFFGGAIGAIINKRPQWAFSHLMPILLLAFGITLTIGSWQMLVNLYELTGWEYLPVLFNNNYLFWRLGHVFIVMAIFMWSIPRIGKIPSLITKIGGETLTIYGVHYIILYGTWLGLGLSQTIGYRTLAPVPCIIGAVVFVFAHIMLIRHIEPLRQIWYGQIPNWFKRQYRMAIVWWKREWPRQRAILLLQWQDLLAGAPNWLLPLVRVMSRKTKD